MLPESALFKGDGAVLWIVNHSFSSCFQPRQISHHFSFSSTAHFGCLLECLMSVKGSIGFDTGLLSCVND